MSAACIVLTTAAASSFVWKTITPYVNCRSPTMWVLVSFTGIAPICFAFSHAVAPPLKQLTTAGAAIMRSASSCPHIPLVSGARLMAIMMPPPFMLPSLSCSVFTSVSFTVALVGWVAICLPQVWVQTGAYVALPIIIIGLLMPRVLRKQTPRRDFMSDM